MDPLWIPVIALFFIALFAGLVALLDYLGSRAKLAPQHKKA